MRGAGVTTRVAVLGAGSWGTTFAKVLADGDAEVALWARRPALAEAIARRRRNDQYLPGVRLPDGIVPDWRLATCLDGAHMVFLSVPSQTLRANLRELGGLLAHDAVVVSLMKGVENGTRRRMSEVIEEELHVGAERIAVVSGPNLATEIAREQPTAAVVASSDLATATAVAMVATNRYFRSFVNTDVIGTEFGGVLKNLIAVAIGIVDGVGYGDNTKASILTRGLAEMTDFAVAYGAQAETLAGLAGLGDLIATSESPLSRNNRAGTAARSGVHARRRAAHHGADRGGTRIARPGARTRRGTRGAHAHLPAGRRCPRRYARPAGHRPASDHGPPAGRGVRRRT